MANILEVPPYFLGFMVSTYEQIVLMLLQFTIIENGQIPYQSNKKKDNNINLILNRVTEWLSERWLSGAPLYIQEVPFNNTFDPQIYQLSS